MTSVFNVGSAKEPYLFANDSRGCFQTSNNSNLYDSVLSDLVTLYKHAPMSTQEYVEELPMKYTSHQA